MRLRGQILIATILVLVVVVINRIDSALTAPAALVCLIALGLMVAAT